MNVFTSRVTIGIGLLSIPSLIGTAYAQNMMQSPTPATAMQNSRMSNGMMHRNLTKADTRFLKNAAIGGMFEIKSSKLALQKSRNPQVRQFAQMMVTQHSSMANDLKQVARSKGFSLPMALDKSHQQIYNHLTKLRGSEFDSSYLTAQQMAHIQAVDVFSNGSEGARDPDIRTFASNNLSIIRGHLTMAQNLRNGDNRSVAQGSPMSPMHPPTRTTSTGTTPP